MLVILDRANGESSPRHNIFRPLLGYSSNGFIEFFDKIVGAMMCCAEHTYTSTICDHVAVKYRVLLRDNSVLLWRRSQPDSTIASSIALNDWKKGSVQVDALGFWAHPCQN